MKKILLITFIIISNCNFLYSQESFNPDNSGNSGKPIAEIFSNFHYSLNDDTTTGFGINRAFIGYNYLHNQNLSATIILNVGHPDELMEEAEPRHYAYVREASLRYTYNDLSLFFGMTTTRLFGTQQRFWGKRYLSEPIETLHDFGSNADLGFVVDYKPGDKLTFDLSVTNGEGFSDLQLDNNLKTSAGITIMPWSKMTLRFYGDILIPGNMLQSTLLCFAGFKNELITLGAEIIYQTNHELIEDHNLWGFSATGSIGILKDTELFVRYDHSSSTKVPGEEAEWYYDDDDFLMSGIQYTINNNLRIALSYHGTYPSVAGENRKELIYLSTRFFF
jgi:hypothetical protein